MSEQIKDSISDKLDPKTITTVLIIGVLQFEIFKLPREVVLVAGRDAWISVLLGSVFISVVTYLLVRLAAGFPRENLFQYSRKVGGKPLGYIFAIGYFLFWAIILVLVFKNFTEDTRTFFLHKTPILIPLVLLTIGIIWLVSYGFAAVVRFFHFMLPFFAVPMFLIIILSTRNIKTNAFLPVLAGGLMPVVKGAIVYAGYMHGLEVLLFVIPFLTSAKKALKPALIGINIVNFLGFMEVVTAIGLLGAKTTQELIWPGFSMLGYTQVPGLSIERFGLLLTVPWLIGIFTSACLVLYLISYGITQIFKLNNSRATVAITAGISVLLIYLIPDFAWTIQISKIVHMFSLVFIFLIPALILVLAFLQGKVEYES